MEFIKIVGVGGNTFKIELLKANILSNKYSLIDLKMDINRHLRNDIQTQIYKDLNLDVGLELDEVLDKFKESPLFKKWLNVNKSRYLTLMKDDIVLDDDNFKDIELQTNDIINYIITPRF